MTRSHSPITLAFCSSDFEAQIIAAALNAEGIKAVVPGMHGAGWAGAGNPFAPATVMVQRAERMNALRVLRRLRAEANGQPVDDDVPVRALTSSGACIVCGYDMSGLDHEQVCPECGTNLADDASISAASTTAAASAGASILRSRSLRWLMVILLLAAAAAAVIQLPR